jgi:hypothetical protein
MTGFLSILSLTLIGCAWPPAKRRHGLLYSNEWRDLAMWDFTFCWWPSFAYIYYITAAETIPKANSWAEPARESGTGPPHKLTVHHGTNHTFSLLQLSWAGRRPAPAILHIRNNPNLFSDYIVAATAQNWRYRWETLCNAGSLWSLN